MPRRNNKLPSSEDFPLLKPLGLKPVFTNGNGNCLFYALSDQIFGDQTYGLEIRATVVEYMRAHPDDFKPYIVAEVGGGQRRNNRRGAAKGTTAFVPASEDQVDVAWGHYLRQMALKETYGTNLEITAFARAYNVDVEVFQQEGMTSVRASNDDINRPKARIVLYSFEHFASVRKINSPEGSRPMAAVDLQLFSVSSDVISIAELPSPTATFVSSPYYPASTPPSSPLSSCCSATSASSISTTTTASPLPSPTISPTSCKGKAEVIEEIIDLGKQNIAIPAKKRKLAVSRRQLAE